MKRLGRTVRGGGRMTSWRRPCSGDGPRSASSTTRWGDWAGRRGVWSSAPCCRPFPLTGRFLVLALVLALTTQQQVRDSMKDAQYRYNRFVQASQKNAGFGEWQRKGEQSSPASLGQRTTTFIVARGGGKAKGRGHAPRPAWASGADQGKPLETRAVPTITLEAPGRR